MLMGRLFKQSRTLQDTQADLRVGAAELSSEADREAIPKTCATTGKFTRAAALPLWI